MWDLPGPGLEPVSPALASGFLTTAPPGKSQGCNSWLWLLSDRLFLIVIVYPTSLCKIAHFVIVNGFFFFLILMGFEWNRAVCTRQWSGSGQLCRLRAPLMAPTSCEFWGSLSGLWKPPCPAFVKHLSATVSLVVIVASGKFGQPFPSF